MADEKRDTKPHTRLTRLCAAMAEGLENHPEASGHERFVIVLADPSVGRHGTMLGGYETDVDAALDLFEHMRAIFRVNGQELMLMPMTNPTAADDN